MNMQKNDTITTNSPQIFICFAVHNGLDYTLAFIKNVLESTYKKISIIICDDGSTDNTAKVIESQYPEIILLKGDGNLWWAESMNMCIKEALKLGDLNNDFIFTINNDTLLENNTFEKVLNFYYSHNGIVGLLNVDINNPISIEPSAYKIRDKGFFPRQHAPIHKLGDNTLQYDSEEYIEVDSLAGKGVFVPLKSFYEIGLYDSKHFPQYHGDTDWIYRAKRSGYKIFFYYGTKVYSFVENTGLGTTKSKPNFKTFLKSFFNIKSEHYISALYFRSKFHHGPFFILYFFATIIKKIQHFIIFKSR